MRSNIKLHFCKSQLFKRFIHDSPVMLVDIGASGGIHYRWEALKGSIKCIGFEPDAEECKNLNESNEYNYTYFPLALHNKKGKIEFYLTRNRRCSSLLKPNYSLLQKFKGFEDFIIDQTVEVYCDTLDNVLIDNGINDIDFIKIDTQGSELFILKGAEKTLTKCFVFGIEVELEFVTMYDRQTLFSEVDSYIRGKGYTMFDVSFPLGRKARKTGTDIKTKEQVVFAHVIYFRDILESNSSLLECCSVEKAFKSIALAELHGFPDFSLVLLDFYHNKKIIETELYNKIKDLLLIKDKISPELQFARDIKNALVKLTKARFPSLYGLLRR